MHHQHQDIIIGGITSKAMGNTGTFSDQFCLQITRYIYFGTWFNLIKSLEESQMTTVLNACSQAFTKINVFRHFKQNILLRSRHHGTNQI